MANFNIGNNFDVAFKKAKETLQAQGNATPKTSEIIQAMLQNIDNKQGILKGWQVEHPSAPTTPANTQTPSETKYGANIPTPSAPTTPANTQTPSETKYGANIPTPSAPTTPANTQTPSETKYGANIPTPSAPTTPSNTQTPSETKYGANIPDPSQSTSISDQNNAPTETPHVTKNKKVMIKQGETVPEDAYTISGQKILKGTIINKSTIIIIPDKNL